MITPDTPIHKIHTSARLLNICKRLDIRSVGELIELQPRELSAIRGFGKKLLDEVEDIKDAVEDSGIKSRVVFSYEAFEEEIAKKVNDALNNQWQEDVIPPMDGNASHEVLCRDDSYYIGYYHRYTGWHDNLGNARVPRMWMRIP